MSYFRLYVFLLLLLTFHGTALAIHVKDVTYGTSVGQVVFNHSSHMAQTNMSKNCRACHDVLFDLKKRQHATMADMAKGRSCGACHNGTKAFPLTECAHCHQSGEVVFKVKATGPTRFNHKSHLVTSPDCTRCHPSLFTTDRTKHATMADMEKGRSCGACHDGKKAFGVDACLTCHPVKEITYRVKATGPTPFSHTSHLKVATCSSCHPRPYVTDRKNLHSSMAAMERGQSCGTCHNSKTAFTVKECVKCHLTRELQFAVPDAGNVLFSHTSHIALYRCGDCHTSRFKTGRSTTKVTMKEMEAGKSCGGCHEGKTAFTVADTCGSCHKEQSPKISGGEHVHDSRR